MESRIQVLSRTIFSLKSKALVVLGGLFDKSRNYHMGGAKEEHEWKYLLPDAWGVMAKILHSISIGGLDAHHAREI